MLLRALGGSSEGRVRSLVAAGRTFELMATSEEPFDLEFREFLMNIYGLDLAEPSPGPMPEMILDWSAPVPARDS